jgi:hypothetical protein
MRLLTSTALALALSLGVVVAIAPTHSQAQVSVGVGIGVGVAPPPLPVYAQPPAPGYGYMWTPGYWGWGDYGYYWVPGTWVLPPSIGFLWTPPWWGFVGGVYVFNAGYWGPFVGFYGGINYGFGYGGWGYDGGYWRGRDFYYNRSVNNITNISSTHVYNRPVAAAGGLSRVSFNGGPRGVQTRPTDGQLAAARATHLGSTSAQLQHVQTARAQPSLRASINHGAPSIAATTRPAALRGSGVVAAAGAASTRAALSTAGGAGHLQARGAQGSSARVSSAQGSRSPAASRTASATHATPHAPSGRTQALAQSRQASGHSTAYRTASRTSYNRAGYAAAPSHAARFESAPARSAMARPESFGGQQRFASAPRAPAAAPHASGRPR